VARIKYYLGIIIMIWSIFTSAKDYSPVVVGEEDGFVDLTFQNIESKSTNNGNNEYFAKGILNDSKVGFSIEFLPEWKPQDVEGIDEAFYWGEANFKTTGSDTKNFLSVLATLYGAELKEFEIPNSVYAQVVGLACNPKEIAHKPCKMKFFFNPDGDEELYSEVFINIDLEAKTLEFNEKDNDYRAPLLRSLLK
jgi:hypothetical protein